MAHPHRNDSIPSVPFVMSETWTNLTGHSVTIEEVLAELASLPREGFTRSVLQLIALFPPGDLAGAIETELRLRQRYFPPDLHPLLRNLDDPDLPAPSVLFHRRQLLAAFLLGQGSCAEGDGIVPWIVLGPLLLKVSSLLAGEGIQPKLDHRLGMVAFLLPYFYDSNPPDHNLGLMRGAALAPLAAWNRQTKLARARDLFESSTGLSLTDFYKVLIPLHHRLSTIKSLDSTPVIRPQGMFANAPQGQAIERTLDLLSVSYDEYPHRVPPPLEIVRRRTYDIVRSQPLLRLPDGGYACVDPAALGERSAENLHWTIRKLLPPEDGQEYFGAWGKLIEEYVNTNLSTLLGPDYHPNPRDGHGGEITDGLLDAGDDAVLIEVKTATLNDDVRYANDPEALAASIEAKYLRDSQLGTALERLFGREQLGRTFCDRLRQRPPRPVRHAWPLLVVTDRALCIPDLEYYLGEQLVKSLPSILPGSLRVMPLQILYLDDVQRLFPLLRRRHKLVNLLRERNRQARPWRTTFHNFLIPVYDRAGLKHAFEQSEINSVFNAGIDFWRAQGADLAW